MKLRLLTLLLAILAIGHAPLAMASLSTYSVKTVFYEPAYGGQHDTTFIGTFTYDNVSNSITSLTGTLSEAMTWAMNPGGAQTQLNLNYNPVQSTVDNKGGITAHSFLLNDTRLYSDGGYDSKGSLKLNGIDNAYITLYATAAQLAGNIGQSIALASADFGHLYYGDCQPGGMMGPVCMTGWGVAGAWGGSSGSMGGYPSSEVITKLSDISSPVAATPLPAAIWYFLSVIMGFLFFDKKRKTAV